MNDAKIVVIDFPAARQLEIDTLTNLFGLGGTLPFSDKPFSSDDAKPLPHERSVVVAALEDVGRQRDAERGP